MIWLRREGGGDERRMWAVNATASTDGFGRMWRGFYTDGTFTVLMVNWDAMGALSVSYPSARFATNRSFTWEFRNFDNIKVVCELIFISALLKRF